MKDYNILNDLIPKTQELHRAIFDKGYKQGQKDAKDLMDADKLKEQVNAIQILSNATNGDVIKALFPDGSQLKGTSIYVMNDNKSNVFYDFEWWNAPYKKGGNNADSD